MIIYDFTSRLPGPLATSLLQEQGHQVIKIENKNRPDPFSLDRQSLFYYWYKKINQNKSVKKLDFQDQIICESLLKEIKKSKDSVLLIPKSPYYTENTLQLGSLEKKKHIFCITPSHHDKKKLHDTDFLFQQGYFNLQKKIKNPSLPTLPYGGLAFAQLIALRISSHLLLNKNEKGLIPISMKEDLSKNFFTKIIPSKQKLDMYKMDQAGDLLCYHMYSIKRDFQLSITALEKNTFIELAKKLKLETKFIVNQYSRDKKLIQSLEQRLKKITLPELRKIAKTTQGLNTLES
ncbi:CoA transferase [Bacteriovoracaceae bacterium]|nr:CoA transferase [Bacteriovoracaceae bacterium]